MVQQETLGRIIQISAVRMCGGQRTIVRSQFSPPTQWADLKDGTQVLRLAGSILPSEQSPGASGHILVLLYKMQAKYSPNKYKNKLINKSRTCFFVLFLTILYLLNHVLG